MYQTKDRFTNTTFGARATDVSHRKAPPFRVSAVVMIVLVSLWLVWGLATGRPITYKDMVSLCFGAYIYGIYVWLVRRRGRPSPASTTATPWRGVRPPRESHSQSKARP